MRTPVTGILIPFTTAVLLAACMTEGETPFSVSADEFMALSLATEDQALSNPHFFFLPPVAEDPEPNGAFDATLLADLRVAVCVHDGATCIEMLAVFTAEGTRADLTIRLDDEDEHYIVNWHVRDAVKQHPLGPGESYRVGVLVGETLLGFVDVGRADGGSGLVVWNTGRALPVNPWGTVPVKFRIEEGALSDAAPEPTVTALTAGGAHGCQIYGGVTFCWGANNNGQLGNGEFSPDPQPDPQQVLGGHAFVQLAGGDEHTCGVTVHGDAYCWGKGGKGRLGDGMSSTSSKPVLVSGSHVFSFVTAAEQHSCGIAGSETYCWGDNAAGQLGTGSAGGELATPHLVVGGFEFVSVSAGFRTTCAVTGSGEARCWGLNSGGQGGTGNTVSPLVQPTAVAGGHTFQSVSVGISHACAVTMDGAAYCWGRNAEGQLGIGSVTGNKTTPQQVVGDRPYAAVSAGRDFTCGVTTDGAAFCWGRNESGQLGAGFTSTREASPTAVAGGHSWSVVMTGDVFACGLTTDGDVLCWGSNASGQLGTNGVSSSPTPVAATEPTM